MGLVRKVVDGGRIVSDLLANSRATKGAGVLAQEWDPATIEVFVGIDMAKGDHYAQAMHRDGRELFDGPVANDEAAIVALLEHAGGHGRVAVVVDQPASGAQLLLATAAARGVAVAYVTGLQMRRTAELYAGAAKTDPRDAWVLADFARRNADRLVWLAVTDELLVRLRVLNGRDVDLAVDANRIANRCRRWGVSGTLCKWLPVIGSTCNDMR